MNDSPNPEQQDQPKSWNGLLLIAAWWLVTDLHIKAPMLLALGFWLWGIFNPAIKPGMDDLAQKSLCLLGGAALAPKTERKSS